MVYVLYHHNWQATEHVLDFVNAFDWGRNLCTLSHTHRNVQGEVYDRMHDSALAILIVDY